MDINNFIYQGKVICDECGTGYSKRGPLGLYTNGLCNHIWCDECFDKLSKHQETEEDEDSTKAHETVELKRCLKCNEVFKEGERKEIDYEGWAYHPKCLGPYDAWIDDEETSETIHKQGFETSERANEVIQQDYPDTKHWIVRKVR